MNSPEQLGIDGVLIDHWDKEREWWEGRITLHPSVTFCLHISGDKSGAISPAAARTVRDLDSRLLEIKQRAVKDLLAIHNENWNEGKPITEDEFMGRMEPNSILIRPDGEAEISFLDGDLFYGHYIVIGLRDGRLTEAGIEG